MMQKPKLDQINLNNNEPHSCAAIYT